MKLNTRTEGGAFVVGIGEPRLVYAVLDSFVGQLAPHLETAKPRLILDFSAVNYVDSAAIGCLMDLYRRTSAKKGRIALCGLMERVERMLRMTGAHEFIPMHPSVEAALAALPAGPDAGAEAGEER